MTTTIKGKLIELCTFAPFRGETTHTQTRVFDVEGDEESVNVVLGYHGNVYDATDSSPTNLISGFEWPGVKITPTDDADVIAAGSNFAIVTYKCR